MPRITVKDKIIRTAGKLFHEQGYNLTGIDEVIGKADIARGSLYYHFDSKTDLLLAWMDVYQQDWYAGLETLLKSIPDPKKKLLAIFDYRIARQERNGFDGCFFIKVNDEAGKTDPRILKKIQQSKEGLKTYIRTLVAKTSPQKLLTDEDLADLIYFMLEGGITSTSIYKNSGELKKAKKVVAKLI
jgi:AcrR family transcriptional regulator